MGFDATALDELRALLDARAEHGDAMRCDELQAFILAMISGPDECDFALWLPEIIGHDQRYSEAEQAQLLVLINRWADSLRRELDADLPLSLLLYPDEVGAPDYLTWCNAYLFALDGTETDWSAAAPEDMGELLYPIAALGGMWDDEEQGVYLSESEARQLQQELPALPARIYHYWQIAAARREPVRHETPPVGRNDPCPCGSGKKFKQCCLKQA